MAEREIKGWITVHGRHVPVYEKKEIIFSESNANPHSENSRKHAQVVDNLPYGVDNRWYLGKSQEGYNIHMTSRNPGQFGYVASRNANPLWTQEREDLAWKVIDHSKVTGKSVKWNTLYSDLGELITDMMNSVSDPTLPAHRVVKGYQYINSFKRVVEQGGNLSEAQVRQLQKLASSIFQNVHPRKPSSPFG